MRSSAMVNGICIIGKVSHRPVKPTPRVTGKPIEKMFICGATREIKPITRLTSDSMATTGSDTHRPILKISAPQT